MKLTVKNFGPIREAEEIEIAPLTVFVGHSNTGKSYLAMLAYATISVLTSPAIVWSTIDTITRTVMREERGASFWKTWQSKEGGIEFIEEHFIRWAESLSDIWKGEAERCFGYKDWKSLTKGKRFSVVVSDSSGDLKIDLTNPENSELKRGKITKSVHKGVDKFVEPHIDPAEIGTSVQDAMEVTDIQRIPLQMHLRNILSRLSNELVEQSVQVLLYGVYGPKRLMMKHYRMPPSKRPYYSVSNLSSVHYLPAIRGGIMQSHRTLVGALIRGATRGGIKQAPESIPLFNGALADFLEKVIDLGDPERRLTRARRELQNFDTSKVGTYMEEKILFGDIVIEKSASGYPDFYYRFGRGKNPVKLSLMSASSSVSELAPIVLFIRNYLKKGDFFIVEEPEAHLHPEAERFIADALAQLANAGVYVIITTHSDTVIEQIGNFVLRANLNDKSGTNLKEEDCSVCLFSRSEGGVQRTKVEKVKFDGDTYGFVTQDHLDVSSELYNETAMLLDRQDAKSND